MPIPMPGGKGGGGIVTIIIIIVIFFVLRSCGDGGGGGGFGVPGPAQATRTQVPPGRGHQRAAAPRAATPRRRSRVRQLRARRHPGLLGPAVPELGKQLRRAELVLFTDAVNSGCGQASSATGPFYCPLDQKAYVDLAFFEELEQRFKAPGDFAQAYVLAHEIGHHVQQQLGIEQRVREESQAQPRRRQRALGAAGAAGRLLRRALGPLGL